jgi:hypothetical protein
MRNFSEQDPEQLMRTDRDSSIERICESTGLPMENVEKMYESMKAEKLSDTAIVEHFEKAAKPKQMVSCSEFFGSMVAGISGVEGDMDDVKRTGITRGILRALDAMSTGVDGQMLDSTEMLAVVKGLIEIKDPKAKGLLSTDEEDKLLIEPVRHDFSKLNEATTLSMPEDDAMNTVELFEGLKHILGKNTRRWGNAYRLTNSYEAIMNYIDEQTKQIQLEASITSVDDGFHIELLNDLLTGNVNPIYKSINGVRQLIPDGQTLLFDMILLVNSFMQQNDYALQYISRQNVLEYKTAARNLLASISSSRHRSKIVYDSMRKNNYDEGSAEGYDNNLKCGGPSGYASQNFLEEYTGSIDSGKLQNYGWNLPLKAVVDMLNLSKSMSTDFNLKIRPLIRNFVTKAYGLTGRVERAKREVAMFKI